MYLYSAICHFSVIVSLFSPKYKFKFNSLIYLIVTPPQKLVLACGATIRDNMVFIVDITVFVTLNLKIYSPSIHSFGEKFDSDEYQYLSVSANRRTGT